MNMSLFQIFVAIICIGVALAIFIAIWRYMRVNSERRMVTMLECVGLDPAIASSGDQEAIMKEIRQRCRTCTTEGVCERWLAGDEAGENDFCPNAKVFEALRKTLSPTS